MTVERPHGDFEGENANAYETAGFTVRGETTCISHGRTLHEDVVARRL